MLRSKRHSVLAVFASLLVLASCAHDVVESGGEATLNVSADVSATAVAMVVVEVSGPGIPTPLAFNLTIVNGVATGTVTIPAGSSRTISMRAFDVNGVETHRGSVTTNIAAGTNATISLVLAPLTGDTPITATLGSITVAVTPSPATVAVGATTPLTATITDANGPVAGTVIWATSNPGIATVSALGVVSGVRAGQTSIVATFQGVAGSSTVTVTGP